MIDQFLEQYAKLIVNYPDDISSEIKTISEDFNEITIFANEADVGKLIGKNGNMINALKTLANGCKAKNGVSYKLQIISK